MNILGFFRRYPILAYFALTFIISWGGILFVVGGPSQIAVATSKFDDLLPIAILAILAGPSISGVVTTVLTSGREGLRKFKSSLIRKTNPKWYLLVLFGAPLAVMLVYFILHQFSSDFVYGITVSNNKASFLVMGIMTGVAAGFFEEIGWTGFAIPRLLKNNGILKAGIIVGVIWAIWHILPALWLGYASGTIRNTISLVSYVSDPFFFLVIYRILMVWVYGQTKSLPVAMVMHGSLTASARIFTPIGLVGTPLLTFDFAWALLMAIFTWVIISKDLKLNLSNNKF